jgi:prepilin-type processing-associated H-X9-DG protein
MKNWVCGTMEQPLDIFYGAAASGGNPPELIDPVGTVLTPYVPSVAVYHCPADNYIDTKAKVVHPRSYSMNSAVGTTWWSFFKNGNPKVGAPVGGEWLPGAGWTANQTTWMTYGKMSSFTIPGPANTWVILDENPYSINDASFAVSAAATPGGTYLIDFPSGYHGQAGGMSFADGHAIIHKWLDPRTYTPSGIIQPGMGSTSSTVQSPDDNDCFFLAPLTSARIQ